MNIFHKFTRKSLRANRTRTLVTIIGIVLSMSLFTAVTQGANSGLQYMIRVEEASNGAWHGFYNDLPAEDLARAQDTPGFTATAHWQIAGWAEIESQNEYKPYLLVKSISENFTDLVAVNLVSGRMPEKEGEILLPEHLAVNGGVTHSLGDVLTLNLGGRTTLDGYSLIENNPYEPENPDEIIANPVETTYTVVGFYERFDWDLESYSCPGYTALTLGGGSGDYDLFFTVKHPVIFDRFMDENQINSNWTRHHDLLMYHGTLEDNGLATLLWGFAAVLIFLIAFGSVSLIYNSFSISIGERTRQFGILKSVGATKKQIRATVLYEAMLLCAIAIPIGIVVGCAGIGVTLWCLKDSFSFLIYSNVNVQMYLVISPAGLIVSVVCCIATTLVSAWIPARKAIRITAIDSIRQSKDVKIRRRDVRVSWLTKKLFGFEGMIAAKNFGRNRRRYRGTILSLFMSVALFISASSFCAYLTAAITGISSSSGDTGADISYYQHNTDASSPESTLALLNVEGVQATAYNREAYAYIVFGESAFTDDYKAVLEASYAPAEIIPAYGAGASVYFLDDTSFRALCAAHNLDSETFFNPEAPVSIALNRVTDTYLIDGQRKWTTLSILDPEFLPITGHQERSMLIPGFWLLTSEPDGNGGFLYYYYPDEYWEPYRNGQWEPDPSLALILPEDEATVYANFTVAAVIGDRNIYLPKGSAIPSGDTMITAIDDLSFSLPPETKFALVYPYSMIEHVATADFIDELSQVNYLIQADDHRAAYDNIYKSLSAAGRPTSSLYNEAQAHEEERMAITVINVFALGFIVLISLIAMANVFNTISTSVALRRREFAMLKSVGLTRRGLDRMMTFECLIYGVRSLALGLPAAFLLSYAIYRITDVSYEVDFFVPGHSVLIAVGSIFIVVFATMIYATRKIRKDNPIDALRNENL